MTSKEPVFRIVKRSGLKRSYVALLYVAAVMVALMLGAVMLLILGVDPIGFYGKMLSVGIIGNAFAYKTIEGLIKLFVPLLMTSLGLSLAFRMKFWNIGGEGQFIMGALVASFLALSLPDTIPPVFMLLIMSVGGALAGGVYGSVASLLKVKFNTNETLMTLMLNYIALYVLRYFGQTQGDWNLFLSKASIRPVFSTFDDVAWMPAIKIGNFSLSYSLIIAVIINVLLVMYLSKTKHGYEISVIGDSVSTAKYAGMNVKGIVIRTMFISAALIGLAGAFCVSTSHTLSLSITNDVGWTGIIVAWLSKLNSGVIMAVSFLITILQYGCQVAGSSYPNIDANFADLLQGIILFSVLVSDFLIRFRIVFRHKAEKEKGGK